MDASAISLEPGENRLPLCSNSSPSRPPSHSPRPPPPPDISDWMENRKQHTFILHLLYIHYVSNMYSPYIFVYFYVFIMYSLHIFIIDLSALIVNLISNYNVLIIYLLHIYHGFIMYYYEFIMSSQCTNYILIMDLLCTCNA